MMRATFVLAILIGTPAWAVDVTNSVIVENLMMQVLENGYSCARVITAQRLDPSAFPEAEFIVACAGGASDFYRVRIPTQGRAVVTKGYWGR